MRRCGSQRSPVPAFFQLCTAPTMRPRARGSLFELAEKPQQRLGLALLSIWSITIKYLWLAVADLVHPNHPQSIELAPLIPLLGNHSLDDPSHRTPRHSDNGAEATLPLFEAFGKARTFSLTTPHRRHNSSDRVAKIGPDSEQVRAASSDCSDLCSCGPFVRKSRTEASSSVVLLHHHSGFVRLEVETSDPQALQSDELVD